MSELLAAPEVTEAVGESVPVEVNTSVPEAAISPASMVDSGEIQWGDEAPAAEPAPEPVAEVKAPVQEAAQETDAPFSVATLQNGLKEIRLASGQVYKGKDDAEAWSKVAAAQVEATRTIQQMNAERKQPPPQIAPAEPTAVDPTAQFIADYAAQGYGFKDAADLREAIGSMRQAAQTTHNMNAEMQQHQEAISFLRAVPEFVNNGANADRLDGYLSERNLPFNARNAEDAYYALKGRGMFESPSQPVETPRASNGQFQKTNTMPMPPHASTPSPAAQGKDLFSMTDSEFKKYSDNMRRTG